MIIMKKLLILVVLLGTVYAYGQDLNSMVKSNSATSKLLNNEYIDKIASDQVKKLTKQLNLSESQQKQTSTLVMNQLRSEKFQKILSKYTPEQLMGSDASENISKVLINDESFSKDMSGLLNSDQKSKLVSEKRKIVN